MESEDGIKVLIMRGPAAWCAYLGIEENHPLAGKDYDSIPLNVHGGLTYAGKGDDEMRPSGYYWYGWDYGHCDDWCSYESALPPSYFGDAKKWTLKEVESDAQFAAWEMAKIKKLVETVI